MVPTRWAEEPDLRRLRSQGSALGPVAPNGWSFGSFGREEFEDLFVDLRFSSFFLGCYCSNNQFEVPCCLICLICFGRVFVP